MNEAANSQRAFGHNKADGALAQSVNGYLVVVSLRDFRKNNLCDPGQDQQQADGAGAHTPPAK